MNEDYYGDDPDELKFFMSELDNAHEYLSKHGIGKKGWSLAGRIEILYIKYRYVRKLLLNYINDDKAIDRMIRDAYLGIAKEVMNEDSIN